MERLFGEKSYHPSIFEIDFWGSKAGDDREYQDFQRRKIKGNILLAAYYAPITAQELSIELGVALPYLEDEIKLLLDRQYLIYKNEKYLTNIPIFTNDCTKAIDERLDTLTKDAAKRLTIVSDSFSERFVDRFGNENLLRFQKLLLCLHRALIDTGNDLEKNYGKLPSTGPYSLVNGGGGHGIVWGRSRKISEKEELSTEIQGIYNGTPSRDGSGYVIAMNFSETLNAQHFQGAMSDAVVSTATGYFEDLPNIWKERMEKMGYTDGGKANFTVWSVEEYDELKELLRESTAIISELNRNALQVAASITADLAPSHIRGLAEYVGAFVYRFRVIEHLVHTLFEMDFLKPVSDKEKPALCVVKNGK